MGNKAVIIPFIVAVALLGATFLFSPRAAHAADRTSVARGIMDMVTQRLCDRQASLGGRISLIHPSKCGTTPPPAEPTVALSANPTTISVGESAVLSWTSTNATSCTAHEGWSGTKSTSGSASVSPTQTTTYQLDCTGAGGDAIDSVTVTVNQPEPEDPTVDLTANPVTVNEGSASLLSWSSTNATSCEKSGGWSGATTTSGTLTVTPSATTTYTITCTGAGGTANDSVTVNVILEEEEPDAPIVDLVAAPTSVTPGAGSATTTLTWTSTNAMSCTASGGTFIGSKDMNGSEIITPSATTTYVLTCTGAGGSANDSVIVNFVPTPVSPEPEGADVVINEIAWMGSVVDGATSTTAASNAEWIELRNLSNNPVNLLSWSLVANDGTPNIFISGACTNTTVAANGYFLLVRTNPAVLGVAGDCTYTGALSNTTEILTLINSASTTVDTVDGGTDWQIGGAPTKGNNESKDTAQRMDNDIWHTAVPTPKAANN